MSQESLPERLAIGSTVLALAFIAEAAIQPPVLAQEGPGQAAQNNAQNRRNRPTPVPRPTRPPRPNPIKPEPTPVPVHPPAIPNPARPEPRPVAPPPVSAGPATSSVVRPPVVVEQSAGRGPQPTPIPTRVPIFQVCPKGLEQVRGQTAEWTERQIVGRWYDLGMFVKAESAEEVYRAISDENFKHRLDNDPDLNCLIQAEIAATKVQLEATKTAETAKESANSAEAKPQTEEAVEPMEGEMDEDEGLTEEEMAARITEAEAEGVDVDQAGQSEEVQNDGEMALVAEVGAGQSPNEAVDEVLEFPTATPTIIVIPATVVPNLVSYTSTPIARATQTPSIVVQSLVARVDSTPVPAPTLTPDFGRRDSELVLAVGSEVAKVAKGASNTLPKPDDLALPLLGIGGTALILILRSLRRKS